MSTPLPSRPSALAPPCSLLLAAAIGAMQSCTLAGPAAADAAASPPCALILSTVGEWPEVPALAAEIEHRSGLPADRVQPITQRMFGVMLATASAAACGDAMARLAGDHRFAASVSPDQRRSLPARPSASSASAQ